MFGLGKNHHWHIGMRDDLLRFATDQKFADTFATMRRHQNGVAFFAVGHCNDFLVRVKTVYDHRFTRHAGFGGGVCDAVNMLLRQRQRTLLVGGRPTGKRAIRDGWKRIRFYDGNTNQCSANLARQFDRAADCLRTLLRTIG